MALGLIPSSWKSDALDDVSSAGKTLVAADMGKVRDILSSTRFGKTVILPAGTAATGTKRSVRLRNLSDSHQVFLANGGTVNTDPWHEGILLPGSDNVITNGDTATAKGKWSANGNNLFRRRPRPWVGTTKTAHPDTTTWFTDLGGTSTQGTNATSSMNRVAWHSATMFSVTYANASNAVVMVSVKLNNDGTQSKSSVTTIKSGGTLQSPVFVGASSTHAVLMYWDSTNSRMAFIAVGVTDNGNGAAPTIGSPGSEVNDSGFTYKTQGSSCINYASFARSGGPASTDSKWVIFIGGNIAVTNGTAYHLSLSGTTITLTGGYVLAAGNADYITGLASSTSSDVYYAVAYDSSIGNGPYLKKITWNGSALATTWTCKTQGPQATDKAYMLIDVDETNGLATMLVNGTFVVARFNTSTGAYMGRVRASSVAFNATAAANSTHAPGLGMLPIGDGDVLNLVDGDHLGLLNIKDYLQGRQTDTTEANYYTMRGQKQIGAFEYINNGATGGGVHIPSRRMCIIGIAGTISAGGNQHLVTDVIELPRTFSLGALNEILM